MGLTISRMRDNFEALGTVHGVYKDHFGRPQILTTPCEARKGDGKFSMVIVIP